MAFITNYTLSKLLKGIVGKEKISNTIFVREIFQDSRLFFFFNKFELNYLYNFKKFLEDENEFVSHLDQLSDEPDTETYVNEYTSHLTYHLFDDCTFLLKDFQGFAIPPEVKVAKKVKELRKWFRDNDFIKKYNEGEITASQIVFRYNTGFAKKHQLLILNDDYNLVIEKDNSGSGKIEAKFDVNVFKEKVDSRVKEIYRLINSQELERLAKFDWLRNKNANLIQSKLIEAFGDRILDRISLNDIVTFWKAYYKLKKELMALLLAYFKWTYKADKKEYDVITLENFGMGLCSKCATNSLKDLLQMKKVI